MDPNLYAGSGVGGKIRRRPPPRTAATPYERPPAAAAAHRLAAAAAAASSGPSGEGAGGGGGSGWVSRLVDPASRLLAGGAARLFSSVFRKRLGPAPAQAPPLSSPAGRNTEPKQDVPESTYINSGPVLEDGMGKEKKPAGTSDDKALSEIEHLLMRNTFTKVEFDRLTDLLRERIVESDLPTYMVSHEEKNGKSIRTNEPGRSTSHGGAINYSPTLKVHSYVANSPAELAKQYMSSRYSHEPPSSTLRSRLFLENKAEASNIAYDRRSGQPAAQEPTKFQNENPGLPVNGYMTPGLRGRSAIYRMSRSPYFKGPSSSGDVNMSSISQRGQSLHEGGKQVLKRRAEDLENEHGSIGPIRRIRQKSNMMSSFRYARANPRENLLISRENGSSFTEDSSSIQGSLSSKKLLPGTNQSVQPLESSKDGRDVKSSDTIPPQSNKMAEKIFEQLNIIAPSPKEKHSGKQPVANNSSPSISKEPILQDNGPSSMGNPSSSLKFHDYDGVNESLYQNLNGSRKGKEKLTIGGSSKVASPDKATNLGNSVSAATSRKPGFKMAVLEDLPELDDDLEAPKVEVGTTKQTIDSSNRKEQKVEQNIMDQKVGPTVLKENDVGSPVKERHTLSASKTVSPSGLFSSSDPGKTDTIGATAESNIGFTFSHIPPGTRTPSTASTLPVASVKDNKQSGASTSVLASSDLETSTNADVKNKAGLSQSFTKPTALDSTSSDKGGKRERGEDIVQSSDKVLPSAASTTQNAPLHFAATASSSPSLSNGFSYSSSPKLTSADKPALSATPSTSIFAMASSSPAVSSATPTPPSPAFSFGSSKVASSVKSEIAEAKPATTLTFGIGGSTAPDSTCKPSSEIPNARTISSPFSSSPTSSASIFSSSVAVSNVASGSTTTTAPSSTSSTASDLQSASTAPFALSSSGSIFGQSSPAQSTGLITSFAPSTSQSPVTSSVFGSKLPQSEATVSQPPQSSVAQFGSSFPTSGIGASSSVSGTVSFGVGTSSAGSGSTSFGAGTSSSAPGTVAFGAAASSSGPGIFSFGAGTSSSGSGTVSFGLGAGAASSGPEAVSFGAGATSFGPGTVSFGVGAASSGPGTVSLGAGTASSGPGPVSFGVGAASSGPGTVSFGVGAASSGPGTVSFGVGAASSGSGPFSFGAGAASSGSGALSFGAGASSSGPATSASGSIFGNSQFGAGSTFSTPFSSSSGTGFTFSSPSSAAISSTVASTSVFSSSSAAASSTSSFSNPFSSSSSQPSTFTFGQSASSSVGFAFGAQSTPAFSTPPLFSFSSTNTSMNSSIPQPAFGAANTNTGFGIGSTGNDQMNEDSMTDDTNQAAPTPAPIFGSSPFGQQGNQPAAPVFGAPPVQPFQFGGQQQQGSAPQNPGFPPGGSLEFQGGGFSLGSGGAGGDKSNRRVIKVKRAPKKR